MLKIFFTICVLISLLQAEDRASITLTTGFPAPESHLIENVIKEVSKRSNINIHFESLPNKRSLVNANSGVTDGEAARILEINKYYPNLLPIPSQVHSIELVVLSKNQIILSSPSDIVKYNVGVIHGMKIAVNMAEKNKPISLVKATNFEALVRMLIADRLDIIIMNKSAVLFNQSKFRGNNLYLQEDPLMTRPLYMQLHKKNKAYIPKLQKALESMHQDGSYQKIQNNFLKSYQEKLSETLHIMESSK